MLTHASIVAGTLLPVLSTCEVVLAGDTILIRDLSTLNHARDSHEHLGVLGRLMVGH